MKNFKEWIPEVLQTIKKDIKTDHLPSDVGFYKKHFGNRPQNRLGTEEIFAAYEKELLEENQDLKEWVVNRWVFKHGDLYQHFAERLSAVNPEFDQIKHLTEEESAMILEGAAESFGAIATYLFAVLNGVVFPESTIARLKKAAAEEKEKQQKEELATVERTNLEKILAAHQREVARLQDKIAGVQRKYDTDTQSLKKQIKALQQKLTK